MLQPINYSLNVKTPFEAAVEGYKVGLAGQEAAAQRQALEAQSAKALADAERLRAEQERERKYQEQLAFINAKTRPTSQDFRNLTALASESQRLAVKQGWDMLTEQERKDRTQIGLQSLSALNAGNIEAATNTLQREVDRFRNVGDETNAKATEDIIKLAKTNPKQAISIIAPLFSDLSEVAGAFDAAFKNAEDYVIIPGEGVVLKSDIARYVAESKAIGSPTVTLPIAIPPEPIADLKSGQISRKAFDTVFGPGAAAKILGGQK
jgi:hypothetical protein